MKMTVLKHLHKNLEIHHWILYSLGQERHFSTKLNQQKAEKETNFITTPIFYVNAAPHVGHLYCALLADASARWNRIKGKETFFTTGTDEHGLKIQQAAVVAGINPLIFCNGVSQTFKNMFDTANIQYNRFIRTTESDHQEAVNAFWTKLYEGGHIYKGTYCGWYSIPDEAFLTEEEVEEKKLPDGNVVQVSKDSGHQVSWMEESNYNFRLSSLQQDLLHWMKSEPIHPKSFEPSVRRMLQNLPDLSISRDRQRLSWGIPVPNDPSQTVYVWLDALINYLTVAGYPKSSSHPWPPDTQVIGKDILKFHAIYWPAFLIAAGLAPPSRLIVHSHWLVENVKMSKSLGNVVDPLQKMEAIGVEGFRYFLLKEGSLASDGTYSDKRLVERVNSDLANTIGNLLGRCSAASVNKPQTFPFCDPNLLFEFLSLEERDSHSSLYNIPDHVDEMFQDFQFPKGLDLVMKQFHWANSFVQSHEPWTLTKSPDPRDQLHLQTVLHVAMETLRVCGILLQPVIPEVSGRLLGKLGVGEGERSLDHARVPLTSERVLLGGKVLLYPRVKDFGL